ncbi:MAG: hypothetical protein RL307_1592, partial [Pseudomonadota bacterium]
MFAYHWVLHWIIDLILKHEFLPANNPRLAHLCGPMDSHIDLVALSCQVKITRRDALFRLEGAKARCERALQVLQALYEMARRPIDAHQVQLVLAGDDGLMASAEDGAVELVTRRADLRARTSNQALYLQNIAAHDITFGIGPAGTG